VEQRDSAGAEVPQKVFFEIRKVLAIGTTRASLQTSGTNDRGPELDEPTFAVRLHEIVDESVGLKVREPCGFRRKTPEAPTAEIGERKECALLRRSRESVSLSSGKCSLANRSRFEPFGDAFVHPRGQFESRRFGIKSRMYELVVQDTDERRGHSLLATDMDRAPVEARCGKPEQPLKSGCENVGVPYVDIDLSLGPQIQQRVESIVGALEFLKSLLFEMSRSAQTPALIEIDILEEPEMKGVALLEFSIRTGVADRQ